MPAPYSHDLRKKAVEAFDRGERKTQICKTFNISRNTLDLWLKRRDNTGSVIPTTDYQRGPKPKIEDLEAFEAFVQENLHLTQQELADKWPTPVSATSIANALQKINFIRDKKTNRLQKRKNDNEPDQPDSIIPPH